jgi:hypothetical protein
MRIAARPRLCCARARCGAGWATAAPPRAGEREGDLPHPGNMGFFLWLKARRLWRISPVHRVFSKVLRWYLEPEL